MPHFKFPCHYVYWGQVKDHENIKSRLLPIIDSLLSENNYDNPFKACTMTTNISKMTDFIGHETMDKIIGTHLEEMVSETNCFPHIKPLDVIITEYWFNVYQKGDFQEMHNHQGLPEVRNGKRYDNIFSIVYILNSDDEEENSTVFKLTDTNIPYFPMLKQSEFYTGAVKEIKEGTLMIFSNQLNHFVVPVKTNGRITIAFNVACCFE
jgi:predicted 2-oxoglutarate/Fe(II)-dependent dioxygenase YbiX